MDIDIYAKSQQLLETLANSIHDRDLSSTNPFTFSLTEIHVTEKWLLAFIEEVQKDCVCV